jgi:hypothetical protein
MYSGIHVILVFWVIPANPGDKLASKISAADWFIYYER